MIINRGNIANLSRPLENLAVPFRANRSGARPSPPLARPEPQLHVLIAVPATISQTLRFLSADWRRTRHASGMIINPLSRHCRSRNLLRRVTYEELRNLHGRFDMVIESGCLPSQQTQVVSIRYAIAPKATFSPTRMDS